MTFYFSNILLQQDSLKSEEGQQYVAKKKKHGKKNPVSHKHKDTLIKHKDLSILKDSVVNVQETTHSGDSFQSTNEFVTDTFLATDTLVHNDTLTVKSVHPSIIQQNHQQTRYIFLDVPKYSAINVDTMIKQKYTLIQAQPHIWMAGKVLAKAKPDWMILIMILSLVVLGWVYSFFRKYLSRIFQSVYDSNASYKLMNERSSITERISFALNMLFVLNTGFFVYEIFYIFKLPYFGLSNFLLFSVFLMCLSIIYVFKFIFYAFLGYIFKAPKTIFEYVHNLFLFHKIYGILLIPITVCIPFCNDKFARLLIVLGIILFAISFLFRLFRGVQISIKINFSFFYLILYLCTVEILPILILGKFFYKLINS